MRSYAGWREASGGGRRGEWRGEGHKDIGRREGRWRDGKEGWEVGKEGEGRR